MGVCAHVVDGGGEEYPWRFLRDGRPLLRYVMRGEMLHCDCWSSQSLDSRRRVSVAGSARTLPKLGGKGLCAGARAIIKKLLAEREKKAGVRYTCSNNKTQCLE
jgi:hypothetical protein